MVAAVRAWDLLKGLSALAALLAAMVGVPLVLEAVAGSPIPTAMPVWNGVWESLTARDDGTLLLGILKYAAWAGWALFVLSVVADVVTRLRRLPAPRLGPQQQLATQLVGAVLALAVSVPTALPATATPVQPVASASQPAGAESTAVRASIPTDLGQSTATVDQQAFEEYRVRRGDCLWDIAWNELGEPERWPEIYEASRSVSQPNGRRLTDPDLIVTGWVLHIPVPSTVEAQDGRPDPSNDRPPMAAVEPHSEPRSVVTPFRTGRPPTRAARSSSTRQGVPHSKVETALSTTTASSRLQPSRLEHGLDRALARAESRDWRDRLGRESD